MNCVKCDHQIGRTTDGVLFHTRGKPGEESDFSVTCWKCACSEPTAPLEAEVQVVLAPVAEKFNPGALTSGWRRAFPTCIVVRSPEEYVGAVQDIIKRGDADNKDTVIVIDWNDEEQSETRLKDVSKCMQLWGLLVKQTYQTRKKGI